MRILMLHNRYLTPGGEDSSTQAEVRLLQDRGHEVELYEVHNEYTLKTSSLVIGLRAIWSWPAFRIVRSRLRKGHHTAVHVQNFFPLLSPAVYYAAKWEGVPVLQALRNYRLLCPNALFSREGNICEDCLSRLPWRGVVRGCYRGSRAATGAVATMLTVHRVLGTWSRMVDVYVALTEFARKKFVEGGLPAEKIVVKPNFVHPDPGMREGLGEYALFVGRLSPEKGVRTLLLAWQKLKYIPLNIVGDGPLMEEVQAFVCEHGLEHVNVVGRLCADKVLEIIKGARFLVFPSDWYETFGRVAIEAFACGVPVIASRLGAMAEIVEDGRTGLHFTPGDPEDLAAKVEWAWTHPKQMAEMGREARREYEAKYTAERNYEMLMEIYRMAIERARGKR